MELPASATKSLGGPDQIFKKENKMLCCLLTQKIITSAFRQPFCIIQQVGRTVPDAGRASVRYKLITCCWFIVCLAGREYSEQDYC